MIERMLQLPLLALALACAVAATGCGLEPDAGAEGSDTPVHIRVRQALGVGTASITRITLLVSTAITDPVTLLPTPGSTVFARDLIPNGSTWTSRFGLPEGDYFVRAEAFDGAISVGATAVLPVSIAAGTVPVIDLLLSVSNPDDAIVNHAPAFELIHVSTAWAAPGEQVEISILASDADGDTLTLLPTNLGCTPGGASSIDETEQAISAGSAHLLRWTAPGVPAECNLQLELRDERGAASLAFVPLTVGPRQQALTADFTVLAAPVLTSLTLQPGAPDPATGYMPVALGATGAAADGTPIAAWSWSFDPAACTGTFDAADEAAAVFHLASFTGVGTECALVVRATGSDGAWVEGVVYLQAPPTVRYRPALWLEYQSAAFLNPNGRLELRVRSVVMNPNATWQWTAPAGSTIVVDGETSTLTWTAAMFSVACNRDDPRAEIEVTVTDPVWNEASPPVHVSVALHRNACIR